MTAAAVRAGASVARASLRGARVVALLNGLELFGHERGNIEVFKALRDQGASVLVGVDQAERGGAVGAHLRALGFEVFYLPFSNQWSWLWLKKYPRSVGEKLAAVWRCSRILHGALRRFDATHVHIGSALVHSFVCLAPALWRVPLIYRMGDCPPVDSRFNMLLWRLAAWRSHTIVANSQFVRQMACSHGARNTAVIYNTPPRQPAGADDSPAELHPRAMHLVYVGAIAPHKGLVPLVEAFHQVRPEFPQLGLHLDIVGGSRYDGGFRDSVRKLVDQHGLAPHVTLHGHVDDPAGFYRQAAVHIAPSVWDEPLGNVVLEAKREGIPSVVFPAGGLVEVVNHERDGYVCADRTAAGLAEGLRWMLQDLHRLEAMGRAARADCETRFAVQSFAEAWAGIYHSAAAHD